MDLGHLDIYVVATLCYAVVAQMKYDLRSRVVVALALLDEANNIFWRQMLKWP